VRVAMMNALQLAAVGVIIELLDQLRWSSIPPGERPALGRRYTLAWLASARIWQPAREDPRA